MESHQIFFSDFSWKYFYDFIMDFSKNFLVVFNQDFCLTFVQELLLRYFPRISRKVCAGVPFEMFPIDSSIQCYRFSTRILLGIFLRISPGFRIWIPSEIPLEFFFLKLLLRLPQKCLMEFLQAIICHCIASITRFPRMEYSPENYFPE